MTNIASKSISIESELANLELYKYHPSGVLNVALNRLHDMLDGKVDVIEPSNPFTYLLETSSLNTVFAIQEYTLLTRKLYPKLANNEKDIYLHMSDVDYLGRFSEPATGNILFNILYADFIKHAYYDPIQEEYIFKIPRHFKLTISDQIFTLTTPIIIRKTKNNIIDIKFDNDLMSNLFPVTTNYIDFNFLSVNQNETYINFNVKLPEIDIEPIELPIEKSKLFSNTFTFNPSRTFYYMEAFYFKDGIWNKMLVTHTKDVYDVYSPTVCVKVYHDEKNIDYFIPPIYINNDMLGSKVKFLIYTTNGSIDINFKDFKISDFITEYNPVFPDLDLDDKTTALQLITKVIYIRDNITGGKNGLSFEELKNRVIDNSMGERKLPITNKQVDFMSSQNNFKLIKDVDVITNRIFNLEINLPNATTRYPITKINLDMIEYSSKISDLRSNNNTVSIGDYITIIPENTLFKIEKTGLKMLSQIEANSLLALSGTNLISEVNANKYLSIFYHYILDTSNSATTLRAYDLSICKIKTINFKYFNSTCKIGINTVSSNLVKNNTGYTLDIIVNVKKYIDSIDYNNIKPYLVYVDNNSSKFYLEGSLFTVVNEQPIYRFYLNSNFYIDQNNNIHITNFVDSNNVSVTVNFNLDAAINLIYVSNVVTATFVPSDIDNFIYGSFLAVNNAVVTHEEFNIITGIELKYLYKPVHTSTGTYLYEQYNANVPMKYKHHVYDNANAIIHYKNDVVLNELGETIYEYLKDDIKLDDNGRPIPINTLELVRYMKFLFIDYKVIASNNSLITNYKDYIKQYLTTNITENVTNIQEELLENTEAFVIVPKKLDNINVKVKGNRIVNVNSMQLFVVDVYVDTSVYNNSEIRDNLNYTIVNEIDDYLSNKVVLIKTELLSLLYNKLKEFVKNISLSKFTELNEEYIELVDSNSRISIDKLLVNDPDGYNVKENIVINFIET
ncbi:MAG: hypothetical protein ACD_33C00034G0003 [uncultured bacterium]|nr:MAG: hypothetical protein ACD_33C00034G0003 [uncultured bacterium]